MNIEQIDVNIIKEYERNPRKNDHAVNNLAESIAEFGFRVPVLLRKNNTLIDGHLRFKAAKQLGFNCVPAIYIDDMSDAQIKAFRIAVNRMSELATWDFDLLAQELKDLQDMDFDISLTGLDDDLLKLDDVEIQADKDISDKQEYKILIDCVSEHDCEQVFNRLTEQGLKCKIIS